MAEQINKVMVITGASSGIGEAVARYAASQGWNVILGARRMDRLEKVAAEINAEGKGNATVFSCDVADAKSTQEFFDNAKKVYGKFDLVLANAGTDGQGGSLYSDENAMQGIRNCMEVNFFGAINTIKSAMPILRENPGSAIVTVSSYTSSVPHTAYISPALPPDPTGARLGYLASKSAIDSIMRGIHGAECQHPVEKRIRVYTINPCFFASEMVDRFSTKNNLSADTISQLFNPITKTMGDPVNIAKLTVSIGNNTCGWAPGQFICIDNDATYSLNEQNKTVIDGITPGQIAVIDPSAAKNLNGDGPYQFPSRL
jgi:NAD(P)-dependent dehydrogenase (short-subunit alcohol dehydrogenase family)